MKDVSRTPSVTARRGQRRDRGPQRDWSVDRPASAGLVRELLAAGELSQARAAFSTLVGAHQRRASRIALFYLRDAADADEAVQDAFIRAFTRLETYRDEHPFEVWFTRILINLCVDRQRARQRQLKRFVGLEDMAFDPPASRTTSPERRAVSRQLREAVADAVDTLPTRQRQVFILCHLADHSPRDVSTITGMRESTVRVHLFRAVHKLRTRLEAWRGIR
jgi:RNA polymerase sigma-70 factor, ECF subfamily